MDTLWDLYAPHQHKDAAKQVRIINAAIREGQEVFAEVAGYTRHPILKARSKCRSLEIRIPKKGNQAEWWLPRTVYTDA